MPSERVQRRVDRLLDRIDAAEADERWDEVRTLALDVLDIEPEDVEAAAYLRASERRLGSEDPQVAQAATPPSSSAAPDTPYLIRQRSRPGQIFPR